MSAVGGSTPEPVGHRSEPRAGEPAPVAAARRDLERAITILHEGQVEVACGLFKGALAVAEAATNPDQTLADRAFCGYCSCQLELCQSLSETEVDRLRETMTRPNRVVAFLSAYNLARYYELADAPGKSLFYARSAVATANQLGRSDFIAWSYNRLGASFATLSRFEEARPAYEHALALLGSGNDLWRSQVVQNLGYLDVVTGHPRRGLATLLQAFRVQRELDWPNPQIHLDLAAALLECGRPRAAWRQAEAALAMSDQEAGLVTRQNALSLLIDAAQDLGQLERARELAVQLSRLLSGRDCLASLFIHFRVNRFINLRA